MKSIRAFWRAHPHLGHRLHGCLHLAYFIGVFIEAHGFYGYTAGALALAGIVALIKGGDV